MTTASPNKLVELDDLHNLSTQLPREILLNVIGHRGFHSKLDLLNRPLENTLEAFESCWRSGIAVCECDVTTSLDGEIIVSHDSSFQRLSLKDDYLHTTNIEELTMDQLRQVNLKDGSAVITLSDLLDSLMKYPDAHLVIEIKKTADVEIVANRVLQLIYNDTREIYKRIPLIMSFRLDLIFRVAARMDEMGYLPGNRPKVMILTEVSKLPDCSDQQLKSCEVRFDIRDLSAIETIETKLLHGIDEISGNSVKLDGIYMQFQSEMLKNVIARELMKKLCETYSVGVFFGKEDPDRFAIVKRLISLGVNFVNTDLPYASDFYSEYEIEE